MRFDRHDLIYRLRQYCFFSIFVVRRRRSRRHRRLRFNLRLIRINNESNYVVRRWGIPYTCRGLSVDL